MKKLHYFLFAAAALTIVSCADEDSMGAGDSMAKSQAINFGFNVPNMLRGDLEYAGSKAAEKLENEFVVFGTKHVSAAEDGTDDNDQVVYKNYKVVYSENTAGTTASNTANWEYVGQTPYADAKVSPAATGTQTIKYWDYSAANGYTFTAFAGKKELEAGNITIKKITEGEGTTPSKFDKGYSLTANASANLDNVYYSDRVEVAKKNYGEPVVLTFRNFGARVRVGFYSTVKGYNVQINKFYYDNDAKAAVTKYAEMTDKNTTNFAAALQNVNSKTTSTTGNTITVKYNADDADINRPTVTNTTVDYNYTLTLGKGVVNTNLASSSAEPTWDNGGAYTTVFPNEACTQPMLIRCDYTLTSTDGSGETIEVKNARVVVPVQYMQWKPNFAYTYIFKISDKTNGTTGNMPDNPDDPTTPDDPSKPNDPEGLHPITFDAVVVDATTGNQETISSIATNSITTYANGSEVTKNAEYKKGETIYAVNTNTINKEVLDPTDKAKFVKLDKAATESELYAQLNGAKMGITTTDVASTVESTIPAADGTNYSLKSLKATLSEAGTYAYIYTTTEYVAPTYTSAASATAYEATTYYFQTTGGYYYPASGISATNFDTYKSQLYTQTAKGTTGVYDIKVITVK